MLSLNTTQGPRVTGCTRSENSTARCRRGGEDEGKSNAEWGPSFVHLSFLFCFCLFTPFCLDTGLLAPNVWASTDRYLKQLGSFPVVGLFFHGLKIHPQSGIAQ